MNLLASLIVMAGMIGIGVILLARGQAQVRQRDATRKQLAEHLAGRLVGSNEVAGRSGGVAITVRFESRSAGSAAEQWTEVDAEYPPGYPLALHVRRAELFDPGKVARGELTDVKVGQEPFDREFVVDGAPADVVAQLFDTGTCQWLRAQSLVEVDTHPGPGRAVIRVALRAWVGAASAQRMIAVAAHLAGRVREVYAALEAAGSEVGPPVSGNPYRAEPAAPAPGRAAARRESEVREFRETRARRPLAPFGLLLLAFGLVVIAVSFYGLLVAVRRP